MRQPQDGVRQDGAAQNETAQNAWAQDRWAQDRWAQDRERAVGVYRRWRRAAGRDRVALQFLRHGGEVAPQVWTCLSLALSLPLDLRLFYALPIPAWLTLAGSLAAAAVVQVPLAAFRAVLHLTVLDRFRAGDPPGRLRALLRAAVVTLPLFGFLFLAWWTRAPRPAADAGMGSEVGVVGGLERGVPGAMGTHGRGRRRWAGRRWSRRWASSSTLLAVMIADVVCLALLDLAWAGSDAAAADPRPGFVALACLHLAQAAAAAVLARRMETSWRRGLILAAVPLCLLPLAGHLFGVLAVVSCTPPVGPPTLSRSGGSRRTQTDGRRRWGAVQRWTDEAWRSQPWWRRPFAPHALRPRRSAETRHGLRVASLARLAILCGFFEAYGLGVLLAAAAVLDVIAGAVALLLLAGLGSLAIHVAGRLAVLLRMRPPVESRSPAGIATLAPFVVAVGLWLGVLETRLPAAELGRLLVQLSQVFTLVMGLWIMLGHLGAVQGRMADRLAPVVLWSSFLLCGPMTIGLALLLGGDSARLAVRLLLWLSMVAPFLAAVAAGRLLPDLLHPFSLADLGDGRLPARLRLLLATLAVSPFVPLGGLLAPLWIHARYRVLEGAAVRRLAPRFRRLLPAVETGGSA